MVNHQHHNRAFLVLQLQPKLALEGGRERRSRVARGVQQAGLSRWWRRGRRGADAAHLGLIGGRPQPLMAHLIDSGKLTLDDVEEARKALRKLVKKG